MSKGAERQEGRTEEIKYKFKLIFSKFYSHILRNMTVIKVDILVELDHAIYCVSCTSWYVIMSTNMEHHNYHILREFSRLIRISSY